MMTRSGRASCPARTPGRVPVTAVRAALCLWFGLVATASQAQVGESAERERIGREREQALADYARRELDCRQRFIVTSCIDAARAQRRAQLDALRRQEEVLNGDERRRRAAARLEAIRQKTEADARLRTVDAMPGASSERPAPHASSPAARRAGAALPASAATAPAAGADARGVDPDTAAAAAERAAKTEAATRGDRRAAEQRREADRAAAERARITRARREAAAAAERARASAPPPSRTPAAPLQPRPVVPGASRP